MPRASEYWSMIMKRLTIVCLILLALAFSSQALNAIQLGGENGRAILQRMVVNNTSNTTSNGTSSSNNSIGAPWRWGPVPIGHMLDSSGRLVEAPNEIVVIQY
jgi:hypothetical protein